MRRLLLDRYARRLGGGQLLLGGEPARLVRLSSPGSDALDALLAGPRSIEDPAVSELARRLLAAGLVHPLASPDDVGAPGSDVDPSFPRPSVTVVVPSRNPPQTLSALLGSLTPAVTGWPGSVIVVDDGSDDGGRGSAAAASAAGAAFVRRERSGGPAKARNTPVTGTDLVVFLDADTVLEGPDPSEWLRRCSAHFCDERVALVAPRIASTTGPGRAGSRWIESYEELESPLDLGPHPGLVGAHHRLSYVPAAALVARRAALEEIGGFDEEMRYGEDVDLVRRLEEAGWLIRYEPSAVVKHHPRGSASSFARQRFGYGTSAAALDRRHPGTVPPFVAAPGPALAAVSLVAASAADRRFVRACLAAVAAATTAIGAARLSRRLAGARCPRPTRLAADLAARATISATRGLFTALRRVWWPFVLPGLAWRGTRRATLVACGTAAIFGHGRGALSAAARPATPRGRIAAAAGHLATGVSDDAAYGSGVLVGCFREHSARALLPQLRRKPKDPLAR